MEPFITDNINFNNELGEGTSGIVYATYDGKYVFKDYKRTSEDIDECYFSTINIEISVMKTLEKSPFIVKVEDVLFDEYVNGFFMKRYETSLSDYIKKYGKIDAKLAKLYLYQMLVGMSYAHDRFIIHADLKPDNILISGGGKNIMIGDWGHAVLSESNPDQSKTIHVQTLPYRAPEILLGEDNYNPKIDVWSLGIIYYEMRTGKRLFYEKSPEAQLRKIFQTIKYNIGGYNDDYIHNLPNFVDVENILTGSKLGIKISADEIENNLINSMLKINPFDRGDISTIISHKFFDDIRDIDEDLLHMIEIEKLKLVPVLQNTPRDYNANKWIIENMPKTSYMNTTFLALQYFDYISDIVISEHIFLYASACIYLASSINDRHTISVQKILGLTNYDYSVQELCSVSNDIYSKLGYNLYVRTPYIALGIISRIYGGEIEALKFSGKLMIEILEFFNKSNVNSIDHINFAIVCASFIETINYESLLDEIGFYDEDEISDRKKDINNIFDVVIEYKRLTLNKIL